MGAVLGAASGVGRLAGLGGNAKAAAEEAERRKREERRRGGSGERERARERDKRGRVGSATHGMVMLMTAVTPGMSRPRPARSVHTMKSTESLVNRSSA